MHRFITIAVCLASLAAPALARAQHRYALQLFHFNVQYVCGGTVGFTVNPNPVMDLDNDTVEDRIITESFAPIIELFEQHPSWGVDLEMQAYMLDVIAWRHPELLERLRALAQAGQIDIVSFHYSDQLLIGYPQEDWQRSQQLVADTFARHGVPLSRTVFCQEGQAALGMAGPMAERGYRNLVWPKNLWIFQHGEFNAAPLYSFGDIFLVAGPKEVSYDDGVSTIEVVWTFLDDGELLATGDFNPYLAEQFFHDPAAVAAYEAELEDLEQQGFVIATVDQYVEAIKDIVTPAAHPPLLDGTWQPASTGGVKRWLGGKGLWWQQERDNHVRTLGAAAHRELVAAETMSEHAAIDARAQLDAAWRLLFLGQVTDASGINPFRGEIRYGISHFTESLRLAREVISRGKEALSLGPVLIDPAGGGSVTAGSPDDGLRGPPVMPVLPLEVLAGSVSEAWEQVAEGHYRIALTLQNGDSPSVSVRFPGELQDELAVGLALDDATPTTIRRSDFSFESFNLALPTGYIGLGGGRFVIKDMAQVHLAAEIRRDDGDVLFEDQTAPLDEVHHWVFHLFEGTAAEAAELAIAINAQRRLVR